MSRGADGMEGLHQDFVFCLGGLLRSKSPAPLPFFKFEVLGSIAHCTDGRLGAICLANHLKQILELHLGTAVGRVSHSIADGLVGQVHLSFGGLLLCLLKLGLGDAQNMEGNMGSNFKRVKQWNAQHE